jgi:hypothetical protein
MQAQGLGHPLGHLIVLAVVRVLGPAVEAEPGDCDLRLRLLAAHKDGTEVPRPAAVGGPAEELHPLGGRPHTLEYASGPGLVGLRGDDDAHDLALGELADDLPVGPGYGCEAPGPVGDVVGPPEPGGLVGLPLRRHAETLDVGIEGGAGHVVGS